MSSRLSSVGYAQSPQCLDYPPLVTDLLEPVKVRDSGCCDAWCLRPPRRGYSRHIRGKGRVHLSVLLVYEPGHRNLSEVSCPLPATSHQFRPLLHGLCGLTLIKYM